MSQSDKVVVSSKSWSQSPSEFVEISHTWTIQNFSLRNENVLNSSKFSSPEDDKRREWKLQVYPNGEKEEAKGFLSVYLWLTTPHTEVNVNFSIEIQDEIGKLCLTESRITKTNNTFSTRHGWGKLKLCKRSDVLDKLPNDVLKVKCEFSYLKDVMENISGAEQAVDLKCSDPTLNVGAMLTDDDEFSDVTICVGETGTTEFRAHKNILAVRSPYFAAMFRNDMKEKRENRVEINDVKPEVFKEILSFIYTGNISPENVGESVAKDLLVAADRFALEKLKNVAENFLVSKLTVENVSEFLIFSDTFSAEILKTGANNFLTQNVKEIIKTDGWKLMIQGRNNSQHLLTNEPVLMTSNSEGSTRKSKDSKRKKAGAETTTESGINVRRSKRRN